MRTPLHRLLEAEDPDHDDEFNYGWKAAAEGKDPPEKRMIQHPLAIHRREMSKV